MKRKRPQGFTVKKDASIKLARLLHVIKNRGRRLNSKVIVPATKGIVNLAESSASKIRQLTGGLFDSNTADFWAVDVGDSGIRLARLAKCHDGYRLRNYYQEDYPTEFFNLDSGDRPSAKIDALANFLGRAIFESGTVIKDVVGAVSGHSVFTKSRSLPAIPRNKIEQLVQYEIQQQIPFGLDQLYLDYQILNESGSGYDVLMLAIKEDVAQSVIERLVEAQCLVHGLSVDGIAAYNWLKYNGQLDSAEEPVALINIGADITEVIFEVDNQFSFTRPLQVGGQEFTKALAKANQCSFQEAERLKLKLKSNTNASIVQVAHRLAVEIKRSFSYFRSLPGGKDIKKVVLTGGGAYVKGLARWLAEELKLPVVLADELKNLELSEYIGDPIEPGRMATVLGLALACQQDVAIDINLLP